MYATCLNHKIFFTRWFTFSFLQKVKVKSFHGDENIFNRHSQGNISVMIFKQDVYNLLTLRNSDITPFTGYIYLRCVHTTCLNPRNYFHKMIYFFISPKSQSEIEMDWWLNDFTLTFWENIKIIFIIVKIISMRYLHRYTTSSQMQESCVCVCEWISSTSLRM